MMPAEAEDPTSDELLDYLMQHYGRFVAAAESETFYRYVLRGPRDPGPPNPDDPDDPGPEVRRLLAGGPVEFKRKVADRVLRDHGAEVVLNRCPRCGGLCRTPRARQCFRCGHSWR